MDSLSFVSMRTSADVAVCLTLLYIDRQKDDMSKHEKKKLFVLLASHNFNAIILVDK